MFSRRKLLLPLITLVITTVLQGNVAWAETDLKDSKDHPIIPRVSGTVITGFAESNYDEGEFVTSATGGKLNLEVIEGKRTRIMYLGPKDLSPLGVVRYYQKAFADLGEVEQVYLCKSGNCSSKLGGGLIWKGDNRIPHNFNGGLYWTYDFGRHKNQIYWYSKIQTSEALFHVSIYSTINVSREIKRIVNHPLIHLEIIESVGDF